MSRMRYQLIGGLLTAIGLPIIFRILYAWDTLETVNYQVTVIAAIIAHLSGYAIYKRLESFPGTTGFSTILPAFVLGYGIVFVSILLFRIEYSRLQAGGSFLISSIWYFGVYIFNAKMKPFHLAIIPGGQTDQLKTIKSVRWLLIDQPEQKLSSIHGVVADLRTDFSPDWERFITDTVLAGTPVYHVKQVIESLTGRVTIEHLSENTLGSLTPSQLYLPIKRIIDRFIALIVLILGLPLLIIVGLAIRLDTPGPALFRQTRMGYRGAVFTVYKFRTMRVENDLSGSSRDKAITLDDDPRITRLGRFLRKSRLDELPQIVNVLRGEMSWIGPRPEADVLSLWYESELPFYSYRHIVHPGITGWAQVKQGHVASVNEVNEKLYYDFYYIKNFSLWLDIVIVLRTIRIVLTGYGAR
ncbi:sugar transferase [Ochrobactrum chromiisoli]|uniref:Sugar transferase n=1 Tax=Ochrobactrum chromiisoli TaxID=2993941 RepID=A0ABT3QP95_9HYPH|nr:sugar transferase [Ochrobactrum chromiisoli]MCX2697397.1 sugar transferase [Ochrobactrum chromiisoli]